MNQNIQDWLLGSGALIFASVVVMTPVMFFLEHYSILGSLEVGAIVGIWLIIPYSLIHVASLGDRSLNE